MLDHTISRSRSLQARWPERPLPEGVWKVFCALALLLLVPLFSAPVLTDYRISDDFRLVGQIDFPAAVRYFQQSSGFGRNEFRPLVLLTYAWDHFLWGDRPLGYHLTNVLLHTASSLLLLLVFHRLTGNLFLAFLSATLFAIHPVHHSRIAWIAARDPTVCLVFLLISILAYLSFRKARAREKTDGPARFRSALVWLPISWLGYGLALSSYEGAVILPLLLFGMEVVFNSQSQRWQARILPAARRTSPYFLLLGLYVGWWLWLFHGKLGAYDLDFSLAGMARDFYRLHYRLFHDIQHWTGLLYLFLAFLAWRHRKQHPSLLGLSLLVIWFGYLPFLPTRGFADRFAYLSSAGAVLFLGLTVSSLLPSGGKMGREVLLPAVLSLTLVVTYARSSVRGFQSWIDAGRICEEIPAQLKALQPSFPPNSTLVFEQIPRRRGNSHVFPTSFRAAVRSKYDHPLPRIFYYPAALDPDVLEELLKQEPAFYFRYLPDEERLVQVTARTGPFRPR